MECLKLSEGDSSQLIRLWGDKLNVWHTRLLLTVNELRKWTLISEIQLRRFEYDARLYSLNTCDALLCILKYFIYNRRHPKADYKSYEQSTRFVIMFYLNTC